MSSSISFPSFHHLSHLLAFPSPPPIHPSHQPHPSYFPHPSSPTAIFRSSLRSLEPKKPAFFHTSINPRGAQRAMSSVPSPHHPPSRPGFQPTSTSTLHPHPPAASSSTHMYQNHTLPGRNGIVTSQMRIDIHAIKQELHDVLGEAGLPYWKSLNAYLVGQLGRGELEEMVRGWLKGDHCASPISYSLLVIFRTDF